jgi:DNA helicase-2/ATP-dependent DNA helicase PcrA
VLDPQSLLTDLTEPQRQAVQHVDGPLLIVAGAGSGKTRVITRRVAYLIGQGIPPWSVLAITFTNKAAGEMKERIGHVLGRPVRDFGRLDQQWPTICTFHSLCLRVLRHYSQQVGLGRASACTTRPTRTS